MHTSRHPFNCLSLICLHFFVLFVSLTEREIWIKISYKLLAGSSHFCFMVCLSILYMFFALMCLLVYIFDKKGDGWEALTQTHNNRWLLQAPTTRLPYLLYFCWFVALVCLLVLSIYLTRREMDGRLPAGWSELPYSRSHEFTYPRSHNFAAISAHQSAVMPINPSNHTCRWKI